jgi:AcrR family transcriptional regulator
MARPAARVAGNPVTPTLEDEFWDEVSGHSGQVLLLAAALGAFAEFGYHGTTTRDIAKRAGMSSAAIYTHYEAKSDLLYELVRAAHALLIRKMREVAAHTQDPVARVSELIRTHVAFHAHLHTATRVANYELQALPLKQHREIIRLRQDIEKVMRDALQAGADSGQFLVQDVELVTILTLSVGIDVSRWFSIAGRLQPEQLSQQYAGILLRALSADPPARKAISAASRRTRGA